MAKKKDDQEQPREKYDVTPEQFIGAWQRAESAEEVAERLNMPKPIVHARASNYRMAGIKLKTGAIFHSPFSAAYHRAAWMSSALGVG